MLIFNSVIILICTLFSLSLSSGSSVGNGGVGIVCKDPSTGDLTLVEPLDFAEGKHLFFYKYNHFLHSDQLAQKVLQRFKMFTPKRARNYEKLYASFYSEAKEKPGSDILDPKDTYHFINYDGCKHKTLVLQTRIEIPGMAKYFINSDYFYSMPKALQEMMVFHEIVYRDAIRFAGHENSQFTRRVIALVFSDKFEKAEVEYLKWLYNEAGLPLER